MKRILLLSLAGFGVYWFFLRKGGLPKAPAGFEGEVEMIDTPSSQATHADYRGSVAR